MNKQTTYPHVLSVKPLTGKRLQVIFSNGQTRLYDCTPLLSDEAFGLLRDEDVFRCVRADPHGYGVVWNDELDLAESELWINGNPQAESN